MQYNPAVGSIVVYRLAGGQRQQGRVKELNVGQVTTGRAYYDVVVEIEVTDSPTTLSIPVSDLQEEDQLIHLDTPQPCCAAPCINLAHWRYMAAPGSGAVCYVCMRNMARMNSDNAAAFAVALQAERKPSF